MELPEGQKGSLAGASVASTEQVGKPKSNSYLIGIDFLSLKGVNIMYYVMDSISIEKTL